MKKSIFILIISAIIITSIVLTGCSSDNSSTEQEKISATDQTNAEIQSDISVDNTNAKSLIIYFDYSENIDISGMDVDAISSATLREAANDSNTGKLKMMVEEIRNLKGADVFSIQVNEVYPPKYDDMVGQAQQDIIDNKQFTFKTELTDLDDYDTIYFGTPVWWSELPQPVHVFFQQYDFSGKTIISFGVHRGSGFGKTVSQMKEYEPDAAFIDGITIEADGDNDEAKAEFDSFLNSL